MSPEQQQAIRTAFQTSFLRALEKWAHEEYMAKSHLSVLLSSERNEYNVANELRLNWIHLKGKP
jgi:hypothetical protein